MGVFEELEAIILANHPECKDVATALAKVGESPSLSVAILEDGIITSRCYSTVGDTTDTIFQAASISKPINGLVVMKLIEQGKFGVESTIKELLPKDVLDILVQGSPASQRPLVEGITIKQLMSHTAGLTVHGFLGYSSEARLPTVKEILSGTFPANSTRIRMGSLPGHSHSYSGGGITVLQLIVEAVTGKDYSDAAQELVLTPLGMTRSHFGKLPPTEKNAARAYYTENTTADSDHHLFQELAAAGLWTTPEDLLKAVSGVQKSLRGEEGALLTKETTKLMLTEVAGGMALSWARRGPVSFGHNGSNEPGFQSAMLGYGGIDGEKTEESVPDNLPENCGFAIMVNGTSHNGYWKVAQTIANIKNWPIKSNGYLASIPPFRPLDDGKIGEEWKSWLGAWQDEKGAGKEYRVEEGEGGKPVLFYDGVGPIAILKTYEEKKFELEALEMILELEEKEGDKTIKATSNMSNEAVVLKRVVAK